MPQEFVGEFSLDGESWVELTDESIREVTDGDLYLRGHLVREMREGILLTYYRNHIGVSMYVNGELVFVDAVTEVSHMSVDWMTSMCGREWTQIRSPGITPEDTVEFRLYDPHGVGNETAYTDFLTTLSGGDPGSNMLEKNLEPYGTPFRIIGMVFLVAGCIMLGAALTSALSRVKLGGVMINFALIALFTGGYFIFDSIDISFKSGIVAFNTYGRQLCLMLAPLFFGLFVCGGLGGKRKLVSVVVLLFSAVVDALLIVLSFCGVTVIFDTLPYWMISQLVVYPVIIVCCVMQLYRNGLRSGLIALSGLFVGAAFFCDLFGLSESIISRTNCSKAA